PPGATAHGAVREHRADDVDLLAVVDLVPERLQDLPNRLGFRVTAVHQPRYVLETDVAGQQLLVVEHAHSARAAHWMRVEREVHFLDALALRPLAESRPGAWRAAAEQDAIRWLHGQKVYLSTPL